MKLCDEETKAITTNVEEKNEPVKFLYFTCIFINYYRTIDSCLITITIDYYWTIDLMLSGKISSKTKLFITISRHKQGIKKSFE